ncbi:hypothetical protein GLOIN_2v1731439 [Rhizophagus irregularis DAOM 181602=DAOM 197198]|uniref:DUF7431 domain-containing protein n=1 Tax=Rhizophagus irregularis (strain DAOM 181602 / DAOM 197198 / MUCL 43194) TaxID=747089 RepID=A0A2P4NYY8_RHIID|nr:hypothetical protein GLOIN_2v1731439 [Rhizophagus irregularis DAOM 181602=DAOM 197198]POG58354.1 hypothetical protein GLOIN_2v1731439 [Rhizophagus irregularis DAOM 181602=DAOM 197198]|eukprot:XP_025165220.1 hypothetical protein GLOIN_2v1731439 [Rhizophagus irregularis DAOM 181602=DAOM 197198]
MSTGKNISVKVTGEDGRSSLLRLNIEDKLEIIRKILEEDEKIRMNDKLSFLWSTDSSDIKDAKKVTRDEESDTILKDIIKNNTLCLIPDLTKKNIRVKVVGDDNRSLLLRLNIGDKLERIRKILEEDENIKMDNKLSFSRSINYSDVVTRNEESDLILVNIIKNNTLCLIPEKIRVKVVEDDDRISLLQLNIESKLEIIRKKLEEDENIKMDDNLLFSRSIDSSDIKDAKKVTRNEEFDLSLRDIIKNNNTLYLIKKDDYTDFKDRLKLGYGRILTPNKINIEISKEEVCTMEIIVLDNGGDKKVGDFSDFRTKKGWANKISMFFDGLPLHDDTISQKQKFTKFQPKHNFIKEVEKALKSENFDKIYEDFGQFIPTETSPNITLTEERNTWECIEFRNPKSIFEILNKRLRKKLYKFFGKKILYEYGKKEIVNLPLEGKFREIINNEKADCSIFAEVVDEEEKKNDFINCQIYYPQNEKPQLIIHCFQKNKQTLRRLKIGFIVVGYDIHFNPNNFNDLNKTKLEVLKNTRLFESESPFLGIPVLKELNDEPIVVMHYFSKNNENNIEANVFSYNLRKKQYVESSNFNFHVLKIKTSRKKKDYETEKNSVNQDYISACFKNGRYFYFTILYR